MPIIRFANRTGSNNFGVAGGITGIWLPKRMKYHQYVELLFLWQCCRNTLRLNWNLRIVAISRLEMPFLQILSAYRLSREIKSRLLTR